MSLAFRASGEPPYRYEKHGFLHLVLDRNGINWISFNDHPGAIAFPSEEEARTAVQMLNQEPTCIR